MKYLILGLLVALIATYGTSQSVKTVTYDDLEARWTSNGDTTYVVNYWATWCGPCVEELPEFIEVDNEMKDGPFKMILVSLDFPKVIEKRVIPFIEEKGITPEVVLLVDNPNVWINRVSKEWDGNIPVTQFIKGDNYKLHVGQLDHKELLENIELINN